METWSLDEPYKYSQRTQRRCLNEVPLSTTQFDTFQGHSFIPTADLFFMLRKNLKYFYGFCDPMEHKSLLVQKKFEAFEVSNIEHLGGVKSVLQTVILAVAERITIR